MNEALHVFRKDMARLWPLALCGAAILGFGYFLTVSNTDPSFHFMSSDVDKLRKGFLDAGRVAAVFFLAIFAIHQDLSVGDRAVWMTRPISARAIFLAKFAFIVIAIAVPTGSVSLIAALWLKTPTGVALVSGLENMGISLWIAFLAAAIATVTSSMKGALLLLAGLITGLAVVGFISIRLHLSLPDSPYSVSTATNALAGSVLTAAAFLVTVGHQYATRRTGRSIALGILLYFAGEAFARYWPVELWPDTHNNLSETPANKLNVEAVLSRVTFAPRQTQSGNQVDVRMPFLLGGQAADRTFVLKNVTAHLTLDDGQTVATSLSEGFKSQVISNFGQTLLNDRKAMLAVLGLSPPKSAPILQSIPVLAISAVEYARIQGRTGKLTLKLYLAEIHYILAARLPVRSGAEVRANGQLWRVRSVESAVSGGFDLELQFARVESLLARQDQWTARYFTMPGYILNSRP